MRKVFHKLEWEKLDLKKMRTDAGMHQSEVADKAGITRAYYTMIENNTRKPSLRTAQGILGAFGFDLFFIRRI